MAIKIICLASNGTQLFSRSTDSSESQCSSLAILNIIQQMFNKQNLYVFKNLHYKEFVIHARSFKNFSLVLVGKNLITEDCEEILNAVFNALMMIMGPEDINIKSIDKLKREMRPSYPVIDRIMKCVDECKEGNYSSDLLSITETVVSSDYNILKQKLDEWSEIIGSLFCCLLVEDKVVVATSAWWNLNEEEKKLLTIFVISNNNCTALDIPVFLLCKTPATPFRLVSCCLISGIWLCALCGPTPDLLQFEECCVMCWSSLTEVLRSLCPLIPRNIPYSFETHPDIIAFLFIDVNVGKYVLTVCLNNAKQNDSISEILRIFYYQNVKPLLKNSNEIQKATETYWCSDCFKLHALFNNNDILCVMYSSSVPNTTTRMITKNTLKLIKNSKSFNW